MRASDFLVNVSRFWAKVDATGDCWIWTGEKNNHGYGRFSFWNGNGRTRVFAHRVSLVLHGVELPGDAVVMHSCDNPPCVNPQHLGVGTQADNCHDAIRKGRDDASGLAVGQSKTWPPRSCLRCGTTVTAGRRRYCPPCRREATRESHARYRAKLQGST